MFDLPRSRNAARVVAGAGMLVVLLGAGGLAATADDVLTAEPALVEPAPIEPAPIEPVPAAPVEAELVPEVVPIVTSPSLPAATLGEPYSYQLTANVTPATFTVSGLPAGLAFDASSAEIVGTPTAIGSSTVRLEAFGEAPTGVSQARFDTLDVVAPVIEPARVTSLPLATATVGEPYSFQLTSNVAPVSFTVSGLPAGLSADPRSGLISGTPTAAGSSSVRLEAIGERVGEVTEVVYATLVVNPAPVVVPRVTSLPLPAGSVGSPYLFHLTSSVPHSTFRATGLPTGLLLDGSTGIISGTPTREGSFTVGLTAVVPKSAGVVQTVFVTLVIGPEVAVVDPTTPPTDPSTVGSGSGSGSGTGTGAASGSGTGAGAGAGAGGGAASASVSTAAGGTAAAASVLDARSATRAEASTVSSRRSPTAGSPLRPRSLAETGASSSAFPTPGLLAVTLLGAGLAALFRPRPRPRTSLGSRPAGRE